MNVSHRRLRSAPPTRLPLNVNVKQMTPQTNFLAFAATDSYVAVSNGVGFQYGPFGSPDFPVIYVGDLQVSGDRNNSLELILTKIF